MQLKRDTGYALQIIHSLLVNPGKMDVSEISRYSGVPRTIAMRLCGILCDNGMIMKDAPSGGLSVGHYYISDENYSVSLGDVVSVIEKQDDLLAVFDKKSAMYRSYICDLQLINQKIEACLKEMTLDMHHDAAI